MDNLTHALVGAAVSKAGAERLTPLATGTLVVAANAPDMDMLSYLGGPYFALAFRRGITHGWPALVVLPLLVTAAMLAWDRRVRRRRDPRAAPARAGPTLALAALGVASHPTLDWMNTYGMRWGLPFDGAWSYGDALFIVDPWIWLALGAAVVLGSSPSPRALRWWGGLAAAATLLVVLAAPAARLPWLVGLAAVVALRWRGVPSAPGSRRALAAGLVFTVGVYVASLVVLDGYARRDVLAEAERLGLEPLDVMVAPLPGTPFSSEVEVLTAEGYVPGVHGWLDSPRVTLNTERAVPLLSAPATLSASETQELLAEARREAPVRHYLLWSRLPYVRVDVDAEGAEVLFADARYDGATGAGSLSGVRVRLPRTP